MTKMVEFELRVGTGATGSGYPIKYLAYILHENKWIFLPEAVDLGIIDGEVDWDWISSRKRLGTFRGRAPVGTIIRYYCLYRKRPETIFYRVEEDGLKELKTEIVEEEVGRVEGCQVILRKFVLKEINLEVPQMIFVRGWVSKLVEPMFFEEINGVKEKIAEYVKMVREKVAEFRKKGVQIVIYAGEIIARGDTYSYKEQLKKLGFRFSIDEWKFDINSKTIERVPEVVKGLKEIGVEVDIEKLKTSIRLSLEVELKKLEKEMEKEIEQLAFTDALKSFIPEGVPEPREIKYYHTLKRIEVKFPFLGREKFKEVLQKMKNAGWEYGVREFRYDVEPSEVYKRMDREKFKEQVKKKFEKIAEELKRKFEQVLSKL
ncbi:MAG: hypothetical protein ACTSXX_13085 [Candidatus Baldrarchaeia archaeon]